MTARDLIQALLLVDVIVPLWTAVISGRPFTPLPAALLGIPVIVVFFGLVAFAPPPGPWLLAAGGFAGVWAAGFVGLWVMRRRDRPG